MNIGEYNQRLTLQYVSATDEVVTDLNTIWAKVKQMRGQRLLTYEQLQVGSWFDISIPYLQKYNIVPGDPIKYEGLRLTVHSMVEDEENIYKLTAYSTGIDAAVQSASPLELCLTFDNIANVPVPNVLSPFDWNWYLGLPANGHVINSVEVAGNRVNLIGVADMTLAASVFAGNTHLTAVVDTLGAIKSVGSLAFSGCVNIATYTLPKATTYGTTIWNGITGKTIAITIKTAMAANANVAALELANTVTKTLV